MFKKSKNVNSTQNRVIANLVGSYDLSPDDATSVKNIDYLCIYEFEYEGKKYKYRTHQRDTFSPIPETIELGFTTNPNKAYKIISSSQNNISRSSSSIKDYLLIWGGVILACIVAIYFLYNIIINTSIFMLLALIILSVILVKKGLKKRNNSNSRDEKIEDAILNNRTATACLIKTIKRRHTVPNDPQIKQYYKENPYKAKYKYTYNGKNYTKWLVFGYPPPESMKLFLGNNPKDIIHFTTKI